MVSLCTEQRTSFDPGRKLLKELGEALRMVTKERTTRCVVVRSGVPGVFCAGADLKVSSLYNAQIALHDLVVGLCACQHHSVQERAGMTQQETSEFVIELRQTFNMLEVHAVRSTPCRSLSGEHALTYDQALCMWQMQALPMPTVAVVDGYALGGGAELALGCDLRVCGVLTLACRLPAHEACPYCGQCQPLAMALEPFLTDLNRGSVGPGR